MYVYGSCGGDTLDGSSFIDLEEAAAVEKVRETVSCWLVVRCDDESRPQDKTPSTFDQTAHEAGVLGVYVLRHASTVDRTYCANIIRKNMNTIP